MGSLVASYCTIPRDYLSDTPYCALWGFWCLNMANWVRYPSPFSERFPLGEHAKRRCDTPQEGVSQRYLRDTLLKQGKWVRYAPLRYHLERALRDRGEGVSHTGPLSWELLEGCLEWRPLHRTVLLSKVSRTLSELNTLLFTQRVLLPLIIAPLRTSNSLRWQFPQTVWRSEMQCKKVVKSRAKSWKVVESHAKHFIPTTYERHGVTMIVIDSSVYSARISRNKNARLCCVYHA